MSRAVLIRLGRSFRLLSEAPSNEVTLEFGESELIRSAISHACNTGPRGARVTIEVERPLLQIRSLPSLPRTQRRELQRLVASQSARFFRAANGPLVTDACWNRSAIGTLPSVLAVAAPAGILHDVCEGVHAAGGRLVGVVVRDERVEGHGLSLLPPTASERLRATSRRKRVMSLRSSVAAALVLATGSLVLAHTVLLSSQRELAVLRPALDSALAIRDATTELRGSLDVLLDGAGGVTRPVSLVASLTERLPPDAFLTLLGMDAQGEVRLEGLAQNPGAVLRFLREAPEFLQVEFIRAPVQRSDVSGRTLTRFELRVVPRNPR